MKKTMCILAVLTMSMMMVSCGSKEYRHAKGELKSLRKEIKNAKSEDDLYEIDDKIDAVIDNMNDLGFSDKEDKAIDDLLDELEKEFKEKENSFD